MYTASDVTFMALINNVFQFIASVYSFLVEYKFFEGMLYSWNMLYIYPLFISS